MSGSTRTKAPSVLVLKLQGIISNKSTSTGTQSEKDFFNRVELKLEEIKRRIQMPKKSLEDVDMEWKRPTSPVDKSTDSSPVSEVRKHWQSVSHFDVRTLQTALGDISVSDTHDGLSGAFGKLSFT